jgi:hypothetical protein
VRFRSILVICSTLLAAACAPRAVNATGTHNIITAEELARAGDVNLYDAVNRLRPTFLRPRMAPTTGVQLQEMSVYYDGMLMREGLAHMKEIGARGVQEVRYLEPQQANARFGVSNSGGALLITTKK